jgi:propanediol utilization protein
VSNNEFAASVAQRVLKLLNGPVVPIEASGRHIHLSREAVDKLFGAGYKLTKAAELSQPGQFACAERLRAKGPKGELGSVVVLGPERGETQMEISATDALTLGVRAALRLSGDTRETPGIKLVGPAGEIELEHGVIVAERHIHMATQDAARWGFVDGQTVSLRVFGERGVIFCGVPLRVSPDFATAMHIDYDEANACGFQKGMPGFIVDEEGFNLDIEKLVNLATKAILERLNERGAGVAAQGEIPLSKQAAQDAAAAAQKSIDLLGKRLIHERDLRDARAAKNDVIRVSGNAIITALAHDYATGIGARFHKE